MGYRARRLGTRLNSSSWSGANCVRRSVICRPRCATANQPFRRRYRTVTSTPSFFFARNVPAPLTSGPATSGRDASGGSGFEAHGGVPRDGPMHCPSMPGCPKLCAPGTPKIDSKRSQSGKCAAPRLQARMYLAYTSRSPGCGRKHPSTLPAVRPDAIGWAADAFPELEIRRSISCMIDCAAGVMGGLDASWRAYCSRAS